MKTTRTNPIILLLNILHPAKPDPLRLANFPLEFEELPYEKPMAVSKARL